jgi:acyl-CoA synthetase (AMP-forming)/AMP-acid ligase II
VHPRFSGGVGGSGGIIEWCRARVANFKVPRYVEQIDRLPVNAGGKVTKFTLRSIARAILDGD